MKNRKARRESGYIANVNRSKSSGFWCVILGPKREPLFALGTSFLDRTTQPRSGWNCEFVILPATPGTTLRRASEIAILPATDRPKQRIVIVRMPAGVTRIILRQKNREQILDELQID